jgi:hypothetical protein
MRWIGFATCLALMVLVSGCAAGGLGLASVAYQEVRGAGAELRPGREVRRGDFARFQSVEILPATSTMGPRIVPVNLPSIWRAEAAEIERSLAREFSGGEPRLVVSVELLYFQEKSLFAGAELLARVRMTEGESVLFDGVVKAESKSLREHGEDDLAREALKAIAKFLRDQREKAARNESARAGRDRPPVAAHAIICPATPLEPIDVYSAIVPSHRI